MKKKMVSHGWVGIVLLSIAVIFTTCSPFQSAGDLPNSALDEHFGNLVSTSPEDMFSLANFKGVESAPELRFSFSKEVHPESVSDAGVLVIKVGEIADAAILSWAQELKHIKENAIRFAYYDEYWKIIDSLKEDVLKKNEYELVDGVVSLPAENVLTFAVQSPLATGSLYIILLTELFDDDFTPILPEMVSFYIQSEAEEAGEAGAPIASSAEIYPSPQKFELVINEILADPPAEIQGDSNQDGVRDSYDDEFIELVNVSDKTLDLSDLQVAVGQTPEIKHQFESVTLPPQGCVVLFGGGVARQSDEHCFYFASQSSLKLVNSGTTISLISEGMAIETVTYADSGGNDQSLVRWPELTGEFTLHGEIPESGGSLFSPGTQVDGSNF